MNKRKRKIAYQKEYYKNNKEEILIKGKKYYNNNREKILVKTKEYQKNHKEKISIRKKKHYKNHKENILAKKKKYYENNKEKVLAKNKKHYENNKEKILIQKKGYKKEQYKNNILAKLAVVLRSRLHTAIKNNAKRGSAVRDLGCSIDELKTYLEKQFLTGMSWDNWGMKEGCWSIDHIIPLASVDLTDRKQFLKVCHYTNLQPMWHIDNIKKSSKKT